jgi:hypothetical protein
MTTAFDAAAAQFADRAQQVLDGALPDHSARLTLDRDALSGSLSLVSLSADGSSCPVPLFAGRTRVAHLTMSMRLRWRAHLDTLGVDESRFDLFHSTDRQPLVRFEYRQASTTTPQSHSHLHAERGSFSALLSRTADRGAGRRDATRLSSLHFPLGGPHFRPSLADVLEFVIVECGVDALSGWQHAVHEYRAHWRRDEAAATARQFPAETAAALRRLGWRVAPPTPRDLPDPFVLLRPEGVVSG